VNLGSWGKDLTEGENFADLLAFLLANTQVERIRLSSIEPWDLEDGFFRLWENKRMCRHLHLPLQSGSSGVLKRMARQTTPTAFERLVAEARKTIPGIAITTDIIVGFPGETEEEFHESLNFIERMSFDGGHIFRFSPREGTAAALLPGRINGLIAKDRANQLKSVLKRSEREFLEKAVNMEISVLWEGTARREGGQWLLQGLSDNYMIIRARSPEKRWNQIDRVRIEGIKNGVLEGR
jgi:threonylcarbamoyladenosine tRNA methylthiotransferase MtaB